MPGMSEPTPRYNVPYKMTELPEGFLEGLDTSLADATSALSEKKEALEQGIGLLLLAFEHETGLRVGAVNFGRDKFNTGTFWIAVDAEL